MSVTMRVLTVGDGDLSFSLALKRAYSSHCSITATTLIPSAAQLIQTYPNSSETLDELTTIWKERVLFGVDATRLEETLPDAWRNGSSDGVNTVPAVLPEYDIIMFNHPHLGDATLRESERHHAHRHYVLLCHYFASAKQLLTRNRSRNDDVIELASDALPITGEETPKRVGTKTDGENHEVRVTEVDTPIKGRIHVCLCGSQPQTWNVMDAAIRRSGLTYVGKQPTSSPVHEWLFSSHDNTDNRHRWNLNPVQRHYPAPRRYRNGKLGSKHNLGRYGYRHRRSGGSLYQGNDADMVVERSLNFIFECGNSTAHYQHIDRHQDSPLQPSVPTSPSSSPKLYTCIICGSNFETQKDLTKHFQLPSAPDKIIQPDLNDDDVSDAGDVGNHKKMKIDNSDSLQQDDNNSRSQMLQNYTTSPTSPSAIPSTSQSALWISNDALTSTTGIATHNLSAKTGETNSNIIIETVVNIEHDGKRLKWYCRQSDLPFAVKNYMKSKKQCNNMIKSGRILVNGKNATDSSRILKVGDVVSLTNTNLSNVEERNMLGGSSTSFGAKVEDHLNTDPNSVHAPAPKRKHHQAHNGVRIEKKFMAPEDTTNVGGGRQEQYNWIAGIVAYKPVGIRSIGSFSDQTLESITSAIASLPSNSLSSLGANSSGLIQYNSMTKLDTGCEGLCVLLQFHVSQNNTMDDSNGTDCRKSCTEDKGAGKGLKVKYEFTALLHGLAPTIWDGGIYIKLPKVGLRRWKRRKDDDKLINSTSPVTHIIDSSPEIKETILQQQLGDRVGEMEDVVGVSATEPKSLEGWAYLKCIDRFQNNDSDHPSNQPISLSTVLLRSDHDSGRLCNVLCYSLRKLGFPVVNDRFCKREYASLPRLMRNILKNKLCIGCYGLELKLSTSNEKEKKVNIDIPERNQCAYWNQMFN